MLVGVGSVAAFPTGCAETGDIGRPCFMVKSDGDGGTAPITEGEIDLNRDVISFGALECDQFICVRQRYAPAGTNPDAPAVGTCSDTCVQGSADACRGLFPEADLTAGEFTCRALMLDEESLNAICDADPVLCERLLGGNDTPYYCAQGETPPDEGT